MAASMNKSAFDAYRQQVWEQGKYLVDNKNAAKANNTLTAAMLSTYIISLSTLMASFNDTYQASRRQEGSNPFLATGIEASWIDPRFHDYYDFFTARISEWEAELQGMIAATSTTVAIAPPTTGSTSQYGSPNTSQAGAAGDVQPQAPYVPPVTAIPQTSFNPIDPYTQVDPSGFAPPAPATQSASITPLLIGGVILGFLLMGKKRGGGAA